nr:hypothetical protein [Rubripirellula sp.]
MRQKSLSVGVWPRFAASLASLSLSFYRFEAVSNRASTDAYRTRLTLKLHAHPKRVSLSGGSFSRAPLASLSRFAENHVIR